MFISLGSVHRNGMIASHSNSVFNFLSNVAELFRSVCTILHFHHQFILVLVSLLPSQHLLYFFMFLAILGVCEVIPHCGNGLHFPVDMLSTFHVFLSDFCSSVGPSLLSFGLFLLSISLYFLCWLCVF